LAMCAHLARRQGLRDPPSPRRRVHGLVVPAGLVEPQRLQCAELAWTPAVADGRGLLGVPLRVGNGAESRRSLRAARPRQIPAVSVGCCRGDHWRGNKGGGCESDCEATDGHTNPKLMRRIEALDGPVVRWSRPGSIRRIGATATQTWWELRSV